MVQISDHKKTRLGILRSKMLKFTTHFLYTFLPYSIPKDCGGDREVFHFHPNVQLPLGTAACPRPLPTKQRELNTISED